MTNHIVLYQPEIAGNTGNIARTCAGTNSHLHLIRPLGFSTDDKHLKRAGLDYWDSVDITYHDSLEDFMTYLGDQTLYLVTKFAHYDYTDVSYTDYDGEDIYLMFGRETNGLPEDFMREHEDQCMRIPQNDHNIRALNLANSVAIVIYEVLRQQNFPNLERTHHYENDKLD